MLGALPRERVRLLEPEALSEGAVALLAERAGREASDLHAVSGGNPFFVTEVLAAPAGAHVPASVRDAVALRLAAIGPRAREVAELAAVVPGPAELRARRGRDRRGRGGDRRVRRSPGCCSCAARRSRSATTSRAARSRTGSRRCAGASSTGSVLGALEAAGEPDPARLVHHARRAGDAAAIRRLAPAAAARGGRARAATGEALDHWEAALEAGAAARTPEALEGVAVEAYLCARMERALEARRALLALHDAAGDELRAGDDERWLSRHPVVGRARAGGGRSRRPRDRAARGVPRQPRAGDGAERALAAGDAGRAPRGGDRARDARRAPRPPDRRPRDRHPRAHQRRHDAAAAGRPARGRALLEEAFVLAIGGRPRRPRRPRAGQPRDGDGHAPARRRADRRSTSSARCASCASASSTATSSTCSACAPPCACCAAPGRRRRPTRTRRWPTGEDTGVSLCPALIVLGRLRARRGDGGRRRDARRRLAARGRHGRAAAARRRPPPRGPSTRGWRATWRAWPRSRGRPTSSPRRAATPGRAPSWPTGCGGRASRSQPAPDDPEPYARAVAGDWQGAADAWARLGFAYERAEALSDADDDDARLDALARFEALGALRSAASLRRRLRAAGVRRIPRGPRAASRAGPAGLTPRETEVLDLIVRGATNAEIAQELVISPKTVDHHVSAVLAKLGVGSRREAGAAAERLGAPDAPSGASRPRPGTPTRTAPGSRCRGCTRRRTRRARSRTRPRGRPCARSPGPRSSARSAA